MRVSHRWRYPVPGWGRADRFGDAGPPPSPSHNQESGGRPPLSLFPAAFADGNRAVLSHVTFTLKAARTWALFSFPGRYRARALIRLTEDRAQLRQALPPDSLRHTLRWEFGDGTHAPGWAVTHRYAHAG